MGWSKGRETDFGRYPLIWGRTGLNRLSFVSGLGYFTLFPAQHAGCCVYAGGSLVSSSPVVACFALLP